MRVGGDSAAGTAAGEKVGGKMALKKGAAQRLCIIPFRRRSSAEERLKPDPNFMTSDGPTGVGYPLITGRSQDRNLPSAMAIAFLPVWRSGSARGS